MKPTYGVVISSYKYGHLAAHCIETALCQSRKYDKIWFVDDGAGDCKHLPELYPTLNYTLREANLGIVANFQDMLNRVDTDYVMFLGADNWLRPDTIELIADMPNADIVTYDIIVTGELRDEIYNFYPSQMTKYQGDWNWNRFGGHHGSMLYNAELARKVGGYAHNRTSDRTDEDLNLWEKLRKGGAQVAHINQGLLYYRRHKENFNKY